MAYGIFETSNDNLGLSVSKIPKVLGGGYGSEFLKGRIKGRAGVKATFQTNRYDGIMVKCMIGQKLLGLLDAKRVNIVGEVEVAIGIDQFGHMAGTYVEGICQGIHTQVRFEVFFIFGDIFVDTIKLLLMFVVTSGMPGLCETHKLITLRNLFSQFNAVLNYFITIHTLIPNPVKQGGTSKAQDAVPPLDTKQDISHFGEYPK